MNILGVTWIGNPRWLQPNNKVQMREKCWKKNLISLKLLNQVKQIQAWRYKWYILMSCCFNVYIKVLMVYGVQQYFNYIVTVSFIGGVPGENH